MLFTAIDPAVVKIPLWLEVATGFNQLARSVQVRSRGAEGHADTKRIKAQKQPYASGVNSGGCVEQIGSG